MKTLLHYALLAAALIVLPCCAGPDKKGVFPAGLSDLRTVIVPIAKVGLAYAAATEQVNPGDLVFIAKTNAVIQAEGSTEEKLRSFVDLGIDNLVDSGKLQHGDVILIESLDEAVWMRPPLVTADAVPGQPILP